LHFHSFQGKIRSYASAQFRKFLVDIKSSLERVARGPPKRGALGYGLFGLRVNPSLAATRPKGQRTYQQFLLKTGKYSSRNPLDLSMEP